MPTSALIAAVVGFVLAGALAGAPVPVEAQGAPGLPDPTKLPGRPGMPGGATPSREPSAATPATKATAVVSGRVTSAESGLPIRRARVSLRPRGAEQEPGQGQVTLTDAEGAFVFQGLRGGLYDLRAYKTRYVDTAYGARRPGGTGRSIELAEGQTIDDIALPLTTAGVITGRVVDDAGEPVVGAEITAMRHRAMPGGHRLAPTGAYPRVTDDTGTYRLFGLPPGRYYVSARAEELPRFFGEIVDTGVTGLALTYYPSTPSASDAQPIQVSPGSEILADITLVATVMTKVTGTVVDVAGRPALAGFIFVQSQGPSGGMSAGSGGQVGKDGAFTLSGLTPGEYQLHVRAFFDEQDVTRIARSGSTSGNDGHLLPLSVAVGGIADLRIVVPPVLEVPGRVVFEGGRPEGAGPVRIFANASDGRGSRHPVEADADGRFTLKVTPGNWRLSAGAPGWMVKRLEYRGRDIEAGTPIEIIAEPGGRIEVTLTNRLTHLAGTVQDASRQPVLDFHVVVFPSDQAVVERRGFELIRFERGGTDGRFRIDALPPGDYLAVALADIDPQEVLDLDMLEACREAATAVRLVEGETQTLKLTLATLP